MRCLEIIPPFEDDPDWFFDPPLKLPSMLPVDVRSALPA
jgi:hypothetical protein